MIYRKAILILSAVFLAGSVQAATASCTDEVGAAKARRLVDQCIEISPATHPPCNAENACELIINEIKRGCSMADNDKPAFCGDD